MYVYYIHKELKTKISIQILGQKDWHTIYIVYRSGCFWKRYFYPYQAFIPISSDFAQSDSYILQKYRTIPGHTPEHFFQ